MLPELPQNNQKGYIAAVVIVFMLMISAFMFPWKFPKSNFSASDGTYYCRQFYTDLNPPVFEYEGATYQLIKQNIPIDPGNLLGSHHVGYESNITVSGGNYQVLNPENGAGKSWDFNTEDGKTDITFSDYGLRYLLHLDKITPEEIETSNAGLQVIDIYQDVAKPPLPLQENILKCIDEGVVTVVNPQVIVPDQRASPDKDELQLEWFFIKQAKLLPKAWWTPECKPAIYLYPESEQLVNVKVYPKGELAYTDPPYNPGYGWLVKAFPDGQLLTINDERITNSLGSQAKPRTASYAYLYYESKLRNEEIEKPTTGWVVKFDELENLYNRVLPKLGLNQKEATDFIDYWLKTLPESPYYFVGVVDKNQRDYLEPLAVTPAPQTSIRFSLYFEPLDQPKIVSEPEIKTPQRRGFTLVDWGGMVKLHPGTPFTCSQ